MISIPSVHLMKTGNIASVILVGYLACLAGLGQTPSSATGKISGTVQDGAGRALANVSVVVSSANSTSPNSRTATDNHGFYTIDGIAFGHYLLSASAEGFPSSQVAVIDVSSTSITVDFILKPSLKEGASEAFSSENGDGSRRHPPSFRSSGIQGTTAPSGYSVGVTAEENAQVMGSVHGLADRQELADIAEGPIPNCEQVRDLLKGPQSGQSTTAIHAQLGAFYLMHGDLDRSISYLEMAAKADPGNRANSHNLAIAYLSAGRFSAAIPIFHLLAAERPNDAHPALLLADAYQRAADAHNAAEQYRKASQIDPGEAIQFASGIGLIETGSTGEATAIFSAATTTHPSAARLWMGLGVAQSLQQQDALAIQSLQHAVELDPAYLPPYSVLANLSGHSEETDKQIRGRLETLVAANPESPDAHYDYAVAMWKELRRGHGASSNEEIETQLKLAAVKNPKFTEAHLLLGTVYADSGDFSQAVRELENAVRLEPENAKAHYHLAQAYRRSGHAELANEEMTKFQALNGKTEERKTMTADLLPFMTTQASVVNPTVPCDLTER